MKDLFGNVVEERERTFEDEYDEYIHSLKWRQKAAAAIARAGEKCERCGYTKFSKRLEVHHKTYDRFKHELPNDLEVLCHECHEKADGERRISNDGFVRIDSFEDRLNSWVYIFWGIGSDWRDRYDHEYVESCYLGWLEKHPYFKDKIFVVD
jgi:HNH endonuclease